MEQLEHSHSAGGRINGVTTLEINLEVSHKVRKMPLWNSTSKYLSQRNENVYSHKDFYTITQSSFTHTSSSGNNEISINRTNVMQSYNRILSSNEKEWVTDELENNNDEP